MKLTDPAIKDSGGGVCGGLWVPGFTAPPLPLLFHAPFVGRVIVPMLKDFKRLLP